MGLFKKSYTFKLKCPHCKEVDRMADYDIEHLSGGETYYWCPYCGGKSIYAKNRKKIRKLNKKERDVEQLEFETGSMDSRNWLIPITKRDIKFEFHFLKDGVFNPDGSNRYNLYETERYLKMMYHQTGFFPNVGDEVEGFDPEAPKEQPSWKKEKRFVIVMRCLMVDDYNTIQLVVVPVEEWVKKSGW